MPVPIDKVGLVRSALSEGRVEFRYSLEYPGVEQEVAVSRSLATMHLKRVIQDTLDGHQLSPERPIFQADKSSFESDLSRNVTNIVGAQSKDVAGLLAETDLPELFDGGDFKELEGADSQFLEAVALYLKPLIDKHTTQKVSEDKTVDTQKRKLKVDFGIGFKTGPVHMDLSPETESEIKHTYGVTVTTTDEENTYRPFKIKVFKFREGWDRIAGRAVSYAYLAKDVAEGYVFEDIVDGSYTAERVSELLPTAQPGETFAEIPLGAMFCYFGAGAQPPPGFAWVDGQSTWPVEESWVPAHLRGQEIPNMTGRLVGGVTKEEDVGSVWADGKIVTPFPTSTNPTPVDGAPGWGLRNANLGLNGDPSKVHLQTAVSRSVKNVSSWHLTAAPKVVTTDMGIKVPTMVARLGADFSNNIELYQPSETVKMFTFPEEERTILLDSSDENPPYLQCRWIVRMR